MTEALKVGTDMRGGVISPNHCQAAARARGQEPPPMTACRRLEWGMERDGTPYLLGHREVHVVSALRAKEGDR